MLRYSIARVPGQNTPRCWRRSTPSFSNCAGVETTATRPLLRMTMSSATSNTSLGFCSTSTIDKPLSLSLRMVAITSATICGARPSDGSSISSTRGLPISARPIASICCSPPDRWAAIWLLRSASPGNMPNPVSVVQGACRLPASGRRAATTRCARTVRLLKMWRPCGTRATPRAAIDSGGKPVTGWPKTRTSPVRGASRPMVTFMQVDLPAPLRPSRPSMRASPSSNETSCSSRLRALVAKIDLPRARIVHHFGAIALDDHFAEMQQRDVLGELQCHVHVVLDHHDGDVARYCQQTLLYIAPLIDGQAGERLIEQQHFGVLRERHGDLDAAAFAVGGLRERTSGDMVEADTDERRVRVLDEIVLLVKIDQRVPSQGRQAEQRERDVAQDRIERKQRDDLIGAGHAAMGAAPARRLGDVMPEQMDRAAVGRDLAGDQVEQRGLAGAIGADDQPPLARLDIEIDVAGHLQTAECFAQSCDGERAHGAGSVLAGMTPSRGESLRHAVRHSRTEPGTRPSGMKVMISTKMTPSTRFQRTM